MADTWTLDKKIENLKEQVSSLQDQAHDPIFTRDMINEILARLDKIEEKLSTKKSKTSLKAKASA